MNVLSEINCLSSGNLLVAGNSLSGDILREMASECGFEIDEEGSSVIDHLNYDVNDDGKVSTVGAVDA